MLHAVKSALSWRNPVPAASAYLTSKRYAFVLAFCVLLLGTDVQAQSPPTDLYEKAVQDRLAGRLDDAVMELRQYLVVAPKDADAWLNLGLAYSAKHEYATAEDTFLRGLAIAPDYADLRIAYARIAYFQGRRNEARQRLEPVLTGSVNTEAQELLSNIDAADRAADGSRWRFDMATIYSSLSQHLPAWSELDFALGRRLDDLTVISLGVEQTRRFNADNTYFHGEVSRAFDDVNLLIGYGGSPNAIYRARHFLRVAFTAPPLALTDSWKIIGEVDGSWARYPLGEVNSLQPLMTFTSGDDFSFSIRYLYTINELGRALSGFAMHGEAAIAPSWRLNAGYANAPDSSIGTTVEVRTVSLGLSWDVTDSTTLRFTAAQEAGRPYSRTDVALSLARRF